MTFPSSKGLKKLAMCISGVSGLHAEEMVQRPFGGNVIGGMQEASRTEAK